MGKVTREAADLVRQIPLSDTDIASIQKQRLQHSLDISVDQVAGMAKWLSTSLFAVNSGGVLTILNSIDKIYIPNIPGSLFILGVILALLNGAALQEVYNRISEPLADLVDYWAEVEKGASIDIARQQALAANINKFKKWAWLPPLFGWLSGISFVSGAVSVAFLLK